MKKTMQDIKAVPDGSPLERSVGTLPGIGDRRREAFSRLGITTVEDLLRHFPRAYQNWGNIHTLGEELPGESCAYLLVIGTEPRSATLKNRMTVTKFSAFDETGTVQITYFNARFTEKQFHVGETHRFWGKLEKTKGRLCMTSPVHEIVLQGIPMAEFKPVYPCVSGLTQNLIRDTVAEALPDSGSFPSALPEGFRRRLGLPAAAEAVSMIHAPEALRDITDARRYFAAEEAYLFALALAMSGKRKKSDIPPKMKEVALTPFLSALGFPLTGAQSRSVREICLDMTKGEYPMSRLLSGDVGSGKTAVAAAALYVSAKNGFQSALMAPTEILAAQHYEGLAGLFAGFGIPVALLSGSTPAPEKRRIREALADGSLSVVIGTHALISSGVTFRNPGLVITDEQHRFGVNQRAILGRDSEAGTVPHVLVMSATPIPRTLALILYGELSVSMLDELPPGRQRVDTFVVNESYRDRLNGFIAKQVGEGGQVYIVCPLVEEKEGEELEGDLLRFSENGEAEFRFEHRKTTLHSASEYHARLQSKVFPQFSVGLIHGKMKGTEKDRIMREFSAGKIQILVSTTVIEVGVNVPNASLMIVENAERFGLSQLHQLRGRVGRGQRKAYCVLVSDSESETAKKRLTYMKTTHDGYRLAEYDLQMRGPGDYFPGRNGTARQHGSFGSAIPSDLPLLKEALAEAEHTLAADPALSLPENRFALARTAALFEADARSMQ